MAQQPTNRTPAAADGESAVMLAWERFLSGDGTPSNAVRRMVEDSWRRCLNLGVNPIRSAAPLAVDRDGLYALQQRHRDLVDAACPVMIQAREFLAESGTMMILTDPEGVILSFEGDPKAKDNGQTVRLVPGALWSEGVSGTNAIGTALASGNPVQICAAEHFCEGIKQWTCSASVIRDPYDGEVLGVLDISGLSGNHDNHCLALAVTGAGRIETRLATIEMEKRARLLDATLTRTKRWSDSGLVIFDRRGRLVRANENASLLLRNMGVDFGSCGDLRITPETGKVARGSRSLPGWILPDWIEPVIDQDERLGTVLAIPLSRHWGKGGRLPNSNAEDSKGDARAFGRIVGNGPILSQVKTRAQQLAKLQVPVLLLGATGAGKEIFARVLHDASPHAAGPFVPLNCGSMTRDLLTSELFGYVDGAFTGARRGGMAGKFEAANGGTLFLDEIGEMPLDLQAHFLRVLEEGEVYRLGETKARKVDVRVLAATNRDLRAEVAAGNFRMDLFYRLAVTILRLPSLAEHREDIPTLVNHFIRQAAARFEVPVKLPSAEVTAALQAYGWPGNVRELRNVVEGMLLLAVGDALTVDDLPPELSSSDLGFGAAGAPFTKVAPVVANAPGESQRAAILSAIAAENGNCTRAAIRLGIAKSTLYERMKRYGIDRDSVGGGVPST